MMKSAKGALVTLPLDTRGATAIEYGLIMAILGLGILGSVGAFGDLVNALYDLIVSGMTEATSGTAG